MAKLPDDRRAAFTAAYRFYERNWDMPDTSEAWQECIKDMRTVCSEHDNSPMIIELTMGCLMAIDRENAIARKVINS